MSKPRNKQEEKAFSRIVDEVADAMVIKAYYNLAVEDCFLETICSVHF